MWRRICGDDYDISRFFRCSFKKAVENESPAPANMPKMSMSRDRMTAFVRSSAWMGPINGTMMMNSTPC